MYLFFPLATKKMQNDLCCKLDLIPEVTVATVTQTCLLSICFEYVFLSIRIEHPPCLILQDTELLSLCGSWLTSSQSAVLWQENQECHLQFGVKLCIPRVIKQGCLLTLDQYLKINGSIWKLGICRSASVLSSLDPHSHRPAPHQITSVVLVQAPIQPKVWNTLHRYWGGKQTDGCSPSLLLTM